jgi:hypothetical protein
MKDSETSTRKKKTSSKAGGEIPSQLLNDKNTPKAELKTVQRVSMCSRATRADRAMRAVRRTKTTSKTMLRTARFEESIEWTSAAK